MISFLKLSRAKDIFDMDAVILHELSSTLTNPITKIINNYDFSVIGSKCLEVGCCLPNN